VAITSKKFRMYAKQRHLLAADYSIPVKRRTQALAMALLWVRLADRIDQDNAKLPIEPVHADYP
jgi:hypothetical protein